MYVYELRTWGPTGDEEITFWRSHMEAVMYVTKKHKKVITYWLHKNYEKAEESAVWAA